MSEWLLDEENNLVYENDERHTIVCNFSCSLRNPEMRADALKIVATPDLLTAAMKLVEMYDAHFSLTDYSAFEVSKHYVDELADAFEAARSAVKKATGA
jgi:hypothetical protein